MQTETVPVFHPFKVVLTSGTRERHYICNAISIDEAQNVAKDFLIGERLWKITDTIQTDLKLVAI